MDEESLEWMEQLWKERLIAHEQECQAAGITREDRICLPGRDLSRGWAPTTVDKLRALGTSLHEEALLQSSEVFAFLFSSPSLSLFFPLSSLSFPLPPFLLCVLLMTLAPRHQHQK